MDDEATPDEQAKLMAVCLLDGEGERWQRLAAAIHNSALMVMQSNGVDVKESNYVTAPDMEAFREWNDADETSEPAVDWDAVEAMLKGMAGL